MSNDVLDLIDDMQKELASLKVIHTLLHNYLTSALNSNDLQMTQKELRVFNSGLENLFTPTLSRADKILNRLKDTAL